MTTSIPSNKPTRRGPVRHRPAPLALEKRVMFDGAGTAELAAAALDRHTEAAIRQAEPVVDVPAVPPVVMPPIATDRHEVVFIVDNVAGADALKAAVPVGAEVHLLSGRGDALAEMAGVLAGRSGLDAIHLISHGSDGRIELGTLALDTGKLEAHQAALRTIGASLQTDGDLLLYGCRVGSDRTLVEALARITQADVAASTDDTGARALGGDSELETVVGAVRPSDAMAQALDGYQGLLASVPAQVVNAAPAMSGAGTDFGDGSLVIDYGSRTTPSASESLSLQRVSSADTTAGAISVVGNIVYKGTGSSARAIGAIDSTYDGSNGQRLVVNFTAPSFENPTFDGLIDTGADDGSPVLLGVYAASASSLRLVYDRPLSTATTSRPATTDFQITGGGLARTVSSVSLTVPNLVVLNLSTALTAGETIGVAYTAPAAVLGTGNAALESAAGTDAASFSTSLTYPSGTDSTAPQPVAAMVDVAGQYLYLSFNEGLATASTARPALTAFSVTASDGSSSRTLAVSAVTVSNNYVRLTMTDRPASGETISVTYTAPAAVSGTTNTAIQDTAGNDAASYTTSAVNPVPATVATLPGWTVYNQLLRLDGGSTVAGWATPGDSSDPSGAPANDTAAYNAGNFTAELTSAAPTTTSGGQYLKLNLASANTDAFGVLHGPTVVSDSTVALDQGDSVSFDWRAIPSGDAYDVYAYLLNVNTGATIELLNETGATGSASTSWATRTVTLSSAAQAGEYRFVFVSGSWDASGGRALGSTLAIDNIVVTSTPPVVTAADVANLAKLVTYANSDYAPFLHPNPVPLSFNATEPASAGGQTLSQSLDYSYTQPTNTPPSDIALSAATVSHSAGAHAVVGTLSATDVDLSQFSYSLVSGTGDTDNAAFEIVGTTLKAIDPTALSAGSHSVRVAVSDGCGGSHEEVLTITVSDDVAPSVQAVQVPSDGSYTAGQDLDFTVSYDEAVTVDTSGGTPRIALRLDGSHTVYASYLSGSGTTALRFRYTVQAGDASADLDYTAASALALNGGTLRDAAGNAAALSLATQGGAATLAAGSAIVVDGVVPTFASAATDATGTTITLTYSEALAATTAAASDFTVFSDGSANSVSSVSVSGSTVVLTLARSVRAGQSVTVAYADPTAGDDAAAVQDAAGNDAAGLATTAVTNNARANVSFGLAYRLYDNGSNLGTGGGYSPRDIAINDGSSPLVAGTAITGTIRFIAGGAYSTASGSFQLQGNDLQGTLVLPDGRTLTGSIAYHDRDAGGSGDASSGDSEMFLFIVPGTGEAYALITDGSTVGTNATNGNKTLKSGDAYLATETNIGVSADKNSLIANLNGYLTEQVLGDTTPPTATITVSDTALKLGDTATVTITFSEAVTGFDNADLTVANGTLSAVGSADGGTTWTATFTPTAGVESASNLITLDNSGVADGVGNAGSGTTDSGNYTVDTRRPTIALASGSSSLKAGETATISFTLSEASSSFGADDVTVTGGSLGGFTGSGSSYSATFTPTAGSTGTATLSVGSSTFADAAGNANADGADPNNALSLAVDTVAPTVDAGLRFSYAENRSGGYVIGTVATDDPTGTTGFEITAGNADGYFAIDAAGQLTLTTAGAPRWPRPTTTRSRPTTSSSASVPATRPATGPPPWPSTWRSPT